MADMSYPHILWITLCALHSNPATAQLYYKMITEWADNNAFEVASDNVIIYWLFGDAVNARKEATVRSSRYYIP
ncbi:MAG: hypothetical protein ACOY4D_05685 [Pseudomonadota bacterium]